MANRAATILAIGQQFERTISDLAQAKAINDANDEVVRIRSEVEDPKEQRQQLQGVAQGLTSRLTRIGLPATSIQQLTQGIAPQQPFAGSAQQVLLNQDRFSEEQVEVAKEFLKEPEKGASATDLRRQEALDKREMARQKRVEDLSLKTQDKLFSVAKKSFDALDSSRTLKDLIDAGSPISDEAIATFAARSTGEVGNLTEAEREAFRGSKAVLSRVRRFFSRGLTGRLPDEDRKQLRTLANILEKGAARGVEKKARGLAKGRARAVKDIDEEELFQQLLPSEVATALGKQRRPQALDQGQQQMQQAPSQGLPSIPGLRAR